MIVAQRRSLLLIPSGQMLFVSIRDTRFVLDSMDFASWRPSSPRHLSRPWSHQCFIRMRWPPTPCVSDTLSGFAHKVVTVRRIMSLVSGLMVAGRVTCCQRRTCDQGNAVWETISYIDGTPGDFFFYRWLESIVVLFLSGEWIINLLRHEWRATHFPPQIFATFSQF